MRHLAKLSLVVCLAAASGCNICCWGKRATELESPTDIRKSHFWCLGEDAVFAQPMGPSREDYGLKPTCWREWPADGARCLEDGCCPPSTVPMNGNVPPNQEWEPRMPGRIDQGENPFRDDTKSLPAPTNRGAAFSGPIGHIQRQAALPKPTAQRRSAEGSAAVPAHSAPNGGNPFAQAERASYAPLKANVPQAILARRAAQASQAPQAPQHAPANTRPTLKITVSEPIDTPVGFLAPIEAPRSAIGVEAVERPLTETETLAILEKMVEVPRTNLASASPGPAAVRDEFAPATQPFRLATRSSLARDASDPLFEKKTLSALGAMMSPDARPASVRR